LLWSRDQASTTANPSTEMLLSKTENVPLFLKMLRVDFQITNSGTLAG
jgi:hypothetical protein